MQVKPSLLKLSLIGFIAGFFATILFHQEFLEFLFQLHIIPKKPFSMTPTAPFGVPSFISLSFFGGIWGIVGVLIFRKYIEQKKFWLFLTVFGGIFPPLVAILVVFPAKHMDVNSMLSLKFILMMLLVNAIWGFGTACITKILLMALRKNKSKIISS